MYILWYTIVLSKVCINVCKLTVWLKITCKLPLNLNRTPLSRLKTVVCCCCCFS